MDVDFGDIFAFVKCLLIVVTLLCSLKTGKHFLKDKGKKHATGFKETTEYFKLKGTMDAHPKSAKVFVKIKPILTGSHLYGNPHLHW